MRYTRYNYKKKKNNEILKFILSFGSMAILAIVVGILMANILAKVLPENNNSASVANAGANVTQNDSTTIGEASNTEAINSTFASIQCGYYSSEQNAKSTLNGIGNEYATFIVKDGDKYRVMAGIYNLQKSGEVLNNLKGKGIECIKVTFQLDSKDEVQSQIAAICNGYTEILTTAFENNVEKVETLDFKEWVSNLDSLDENEELESLKKYISEIPEEVRRENVSEELKKVYEILVNYKVK